MEFKIKLHRGQQMWLAMLALVPGVLTYFRLVRPVHAALVLVALYFCSKRHAFLVQRQWEADQAKQREEEGAEVRRLAALPLKKRRIIEKAKARKEAIESGEEAGAGSESVEEESKKES